MRIANLLFNVTAALTLFLVGGLLFYYLVLPPDFLRFNPALLTDPVEWLTGDDNSPLNKSGVIQTVRLWARLAPLPKSARHLRIDGTGQLFDKTYVITFDARPQDIDDWLRSSPGTAHATVTASPEGDRYVIRPRDAAFAEVTVAPSKRGVRIKAFWQ
ncbi:MAG: hypothetical protein ACFB5Z_12980 [Elainellaceae cyanobacterium]